ncbi:MAG: hypothetical protein GYB68_04495, partial [Chloroflexi bacterium]|nr:hypothetical protein [Chloroflexota bacterium]
CVYNSTPHHWTDVEIEIVREFSEIVTHEIDLRALTLMDSSYLPRLDRAYQATFALIAALQQVKYANKAEFLGELRAARAYFCI